MNSYDYYCHLLRSNIRYWQELLIIITGCLSFIGYIVHITNNDVKIGGRIIIYSCGPLYILTCLWYCVKQFQWIMFKFFIYQSHTLLLIISVLVLMTMEIIVAIQIDHDPTMHIVFAFFFSFTIFIFLGMETVNNVSLILYIFYPLIIFIACLINIIRSFSWKTIMIKDGDIHSFSFAQIDRLIQGQIALFTFISFLIAINNPSRKHHIFLYKKIQRFNSVHYDATYESFKKLSLGLQILWVLIATALLIFEYSHSEIKYYIFDCGVVAILIFITIGLIYIEFDWKVLSQVLSSQTSIILIICFFALFMANLMLLEHIVTQNFILGIFVDNIIYYNMYSI